MKKQTRHKPTGSKFSLLRQLCNFIPPHLVPHLARQTGVEDQARTFSPWSHVVSLLYAQLTHSLGLNDVCDALRLHSGSLSALRGATPPPKNTLSHANRQRDARLGRAAVLVGAGTSANVAARLRRQPHAPLRLPFQTPHPRRGFDHHPVDGPLPGLGQTSSAQGRRQMSCPA